MTHFLNLDSEQAEILLDAADTAARFLRHRAARIDPDGVVSKAATLQENKLKAIRHQLSQPPIEAWADLHPAQQKQVLAMAAALAAPADDAMRDRAWRTLRALLLSPRPAKPVDFVELPPDD